MKRRQQKSSMPVHRYRPFSQIIEVSLPDRAWPNRELTRAPRWCAVDLRDGNQALREPMGVERKKILYDLLLRMGFKEIEVGFPAASAPDFDFVRYLIEEDQIPDDVVIQVLTQSREHVIRRTFEALSGAKQAIVHLYNSTSELQRRVVFSHSREDTLRLALSGARLCKELAADSKTDFYFEYSPESFTGTELNFAARVCNRVAEVFDPSPERQLIINLPATVEMTTPNVYADSIEWMIRRLKQRDSLIVSLHPHNDRGCAVAAAELGLLAGADRVEGCLFGNGERTGNVDLITLAMNLFTQGVDPELEMGNMDHIKETVAYCNRMPVGERTPWAGDLVYTAFSGSHQDAIKKGFASLRQTAKREGKALGDLPWEAPYLPVDPKDVGRDYEAIIRVNSQSGKGGVSYLLHENYHLDLPRSLQAEFSLIVQNYVDAFGGELEAPALWQLFEDEYLPAKDQSRRWGRLQFCSSSASRDSAEQVRVHFSLADSGRPLEVAGEGNGPVDAFLAGLSGLGFELDIYDYAQHALDSGSQSRAVSYLDMGINGRRLWGVGIDANTTWASFKAIVSAINRCCRQ